MTDAELFNDLITHVAVAIGECRNGCKCDGNECTGRWRSSLNRLHQVMVTPKSRHGCGIAPTANTAAGWLLAAAIVEESSANVDDKHDIIRECRERAVQIFEKHNEKNPGERWSWSTIHLNKIYADERHVPRIKREVAKLEGIQKIDCDWDAKRAHALNQDNRLLKALNDDIDTTNDFAHGSTFTDERLIQCLDRQLEQELTATGIEIEPVVQLVRKNETINPTNKRKKSGKDSSRVPTDEEIAANIHCTTEMWRRNIKEKLDALKLHHLTQKNKFSGQFCILMKRHGFTNCSHDRRRELGVPAVQFADGRTRRHNDVGRVDLAANAQQSAADLHNDDGRRE